MGEQIREARAELRSGDPAAAFVRAEKIIAVDPDNPDARLLAGEAATRLEKFDVAVEHYSHVPRDDAESWVSARFAIAEVERFRGRLTEAEQAYRAVLDVEPDQPLALDRLAFLLKATGRHSDARVPLLKLVNLGAWRPEHLVWLALPTRALEVTSYLEGCRRQAPEDSLAVAGLAVLAMVRGEYQAAEPLWRSALPDLRSEPEYQAYWGRCLWELGKADEFHGWWNDVPVAARDHAEVWYTLSLFAEQLGTPAEVRRCLWECLYRDPNHAAALFRAGRFLEDAEDGSVPPKVRQRTQWISELHATVNEVDPERPDVETARRCAKLLESLDRSREAAAWIDLQIMNTSDPQLTSELASRQRGLRTQIVSTPTWIETELARFPQPDLSKWKAPATSPSPSTTLEGSTTFFHAEPASSGIDFRYFESPDETTEGRRMFEFTGGGVAAFDFDRDGSPDLYFTQGAPWPVDERQRTHLDALYRNVDGERFTQVTGSARIIEPGFSQGVAAGDFNNDGFPDLYVANFGQNRLFENNGDGTFTDVSHQLPDDAAWTTSCLIADLDGDGLPDLYDANYVEGEDVATRICSTSAGPRVCKPDVFTPSVDRLLRNAGDGGPFDDQTSAAGLAPFAGTGLGIAAADWNNDGQLELFIANDEMANFYFINSAPAGSPPQFQEQAFVSGLAFGAEGEPQACMGIAVDSLWGDPGLDLFVTNYFNESNALYRQASEDLFVDDANVAGLRGPSLPQLGFGTQTVDIDGDGDRDLFVANGDLDDFSHQGRTLRMPAQLFENIGEGRFREVTPESSGPYFDQSGHRGRGVARLDWNGDGREDLVVSQLDEPAVLLTNSGPAGTSITVTLAGTLAARDAIGTRLILEAGGQAWFRQLTAGDGYLATNERSIVFRLPGEIADGTSLQLTVRWPSGQQQQFPLSGKSGRYLIREADDLYRLSDDF